MSSVLASLASPRKGGERPCPMSVPLLVETERPFRKIIVDDDVVVAAAAVVVSF